MVGVDFPPGVIDKASWVDLLDLDNRGEGLTDYEKDFIESMYHHLKAGHFLTKKQAALLERIREERL